MKLIEKIVAQIIRSGTSVLCRIDAPDLDQVPPHGPLILISNHTGSLEVPLLFAHLQPRKVTGWAKVETWKNPLYNWLFSMWGAIPLQRGEADIEALKKAVSALRQGYIFGMAPEGTRNRTGCLIRGKPGIVLVALLSGAPIVPVVHWGGEKFGYNLSHLKRTDFHIRVGHLFRVEVHGMRVTGRMRQEIVDEMMVRIAQLLPEEFRGEYAKAVHQEQKYLVDIPPLEDRENPMEAIRVPQIL